MGRKSDDLTTSPSESFAGGEEEGRHDEALAELDRVRREAEAQITNTLERITDGFISLDREWRYTYINRAATAMVHRPPEHFIGKNIWDLYPDALGTAYEIEYKRAMREQTPVEFEEYLPSADIWLEVNAYPSPDGLSVFFRDVTKRKQAEERLRESEERYRTLFNSIDEGFCVVELIFDDAGEPLDYRFLEINPTFEKQTGLKNAAGKTARELVPNLESRWFEIYGKVASTGEPVRFVNGSEAMGRWFDVYAFRVGDETSRKVAILFNDVTARKKSELERERFFAVSPDFQVITGADGYFKWVSPSCERALGWTAEEMTSQPWVNFTHPDDVGKSISETEDVFSGSETFAFENRYRHKDGSYRWFLWNAQPYLEENVVYGAAIDITTRKRAEDKLRESEERVRLATEAAEMFSWETDLRTRKIKWSENAARIIGCSDEELTDEIQNGMFFVAPEDRERVNCEFERLLAEGEDTFLFEFCGVEPVGETKSWAAQGLIIRDETGAPVRVVGVTQNVTGRKRVEAALGRSQQLNEDVLNSLTAHIAVLDKDGTITVVNESWRRFARENGADSTMRGVGVGTNYLVVCRQAEGDEAGDAKLICDGIREVLDGEREFFSLEYPCHSPTTKRWFLLTASPLTHAGDGAVVSHFDITARKRAEEGLRQSEERYRLMSENAKDYAIIFLDTDARIKTWSTGAERILGWKEGEVIGQPGHIIFTPEDRENGVSEKELSTAADKGRATDERWHVRKDGSRFFASGEMVGLFDEAGELRGFAKIFRDLTERKRMDDALRESEEKFRNLANSISQFAWMADAAGDVFWYNQRWFDYTGTTLEEMSGWGWQKVCHPEEVGWVVKSFKQSIATGEPWEDTFPLRSKTGEYRWFLSRALPIRDEQGRVTRWFGTNTDVEDLRQARKTAEEASRLKDEFLATVSHELRTPLTAVIGWTHLLRTGQLDEAGAARALETVERNARAQNQLIEDLLDISRIITGKLRLDVRPIDPVGFIEAAIEAVRPAAEAKAVRLHTLLDTGVGLISGDSDRLQQVVWNLLSNAIKFTPKGGRVQLRLERVNSHVEIVVTDTGAGIEPEFLPFVFDRFRQADGSTTRAHGGLGLGLSIVRHLVELHGGTVHADSHGKGDGATFTVKLPLVPVYFRGGGQEERVHPGANSQLSPAEGDERLDGVRLLVVDDEADTCEMLRVMLMQRGAEVVVARSAEEALREIKRSTFDLLISDIGMPGADGYELLSRVRNLPAGIGGRLPAVALTAYARTEDRLRALRAGYQMHVPKPVEAAELIAVVSSLAARRGLSENPTREKPGDGAHDL